jgi:hypothetical protein
METELTDDELMAALMKLPTQAQDHFKLVVRLVALCYTDPENHSGLLITKEEDGTVLMSLNANDMDAAELIIEASEFISRVVTRDAPPREQFN